MGSDPFFVGETVMALSVTEALSVHEVAQILSRHPNTVRKYERRGRLPSTRDRFGWRRFDPQDVTKLKEELSNEAD